MALIILVMSVVIAESLGVDWDAYQSQLKVLGFYALAWDWLK